MEVHGVVIPAQDCALVGCVIRLGLLAENDRVTVERTAAESVKMYWLLAELDCAYANWWCATHIEGIEYPAKDGNDADS
jgi:hypothetical protein